MAAATILAATAIAQTCTVLTMGFDEVQHLRRQHGAVVYVLWHSHIVAQVPVYRRIFGQEARGCAMSLQERNGRLLTRYVRHFGHRIVPLPAQPEQRAPAVLEFIERVTEGEDGMLAVDGPNGPAFEVRRDVVRLAMSIGLPIVPLAVGCSQAYVSRRSWDKQLVPLPLSRVAYVYGPPVDPSLLPRGTEAVEPLSRQLHAALMGNGERAAELCRGRRHNWGRAKVGTVRG